ncbi:hypothetical protein Y032_0083g1639 [Ancylostoma ceylanicum]|uniref:Uncharacterized protein n=1 Tax=Ancylostoma ceylanicum TaxID=53326 RepID=A0A016TQZ9_9BILA|nr:hypothetical protein Y032_0083g1639 [Ancylostoma ceylanicum]
MLRLVVLLSIPAAILACTPLPPGQEKQKMFLVEGLTELPLEFVYATKAMNKYPKIARSSSEALKNIRNYVRKSVRTVIKRLVGQAGRPQSEQDTVAKQVVPTIYEYEPMECVKAMDLDKVTATSPINDDYTCLVKNDAVQKVGFLPIQKLPIPPNYRLFFVDLTIKNRELSELDRAKWEQVLAEVKKQLAKGTYGRFFTNVNLKFFG